MPFTEYKFKNLSQRHQNKTLAEILRGVYERLLYEGIIDKSFEEYNKMQRWLGGPPLLKDLQSISDRYHLHLQHACISHKEHNLLPHIEKGDRLQGTPPLTTTIYLDKLRSAHNVGSILRCVEAFSLGQVYFSPSTPYVDKLKVQNTSMGSYQWVSTFRDLALENLPRPIIALETCPQALPLENFTFPKTFTLVVGNEEYGCSKNTLKLADTFVRIPMYGRKNSLNVANAFAIVAAAIRQQSNRKGEENHE